MPTILLKGCWAPQRANEQDGIWETVSGRTLILCHADREGGLEDWAEKAAQPGVMIVSCYPNQVQQSHPDCICVGNWDTPVNAEITVYLDEVGPTGNLYPGALLLTIAPG